MHDSDKELLKLKHALASLPQLEPDADAWPAISSRLQGKRTSTYLGAGLGLAAALVLGLGIWLAATPGPSGQSAATVPASVWMARSQALEQALYELDTRGRVLSGAQAQNVALLQERLAILDLQLATAPDTENQSRALWRHRTELLARLLGVKMDQITYEKSNDYVI